MGSVGAAAEILLHLGESHAIALPGLARSKAVFLVARSRYSGCAPAWRAARPTRHRQGWHPGSSYRAKEILLAQRDRIDGEDLRRPSIIISVAAIVCKVPQPQHGAGIDGARCQATADRSLFGK